jgi:hypothetical protein
MATSSNKVDVFVKLLNRPESLRLPYCSTSEDLWRLAARQGLGVRPAALELYGLKNGQFWLSPSSSVPNSTALELRIRFKSPYPDKLREADIISFKYYYWQVRHDFDNSTIIKALPQESLKGGNPKWWVPVIPGANNADPEAVMARKRRVQFFLTVVELASLNMLIDILEQDKDKKDVLKNFDSYMPKEMWQSQGEKMLGLSKLKQTASGIMTKLLGNKAKVTDLKIKFLNTVESSFAQYFEERYDNVQVQQIAGDPSTNVKLVIVPPFKAITRPPFDEDEPYLAIKHPKETEKVCTIEEICNISTRKSGGAEGGGGISIEIARKNGIPLYLSMTNQDAALSFLTCLSGYYRLCEKWIFSLSSEVEFPSLQTLLAAHVHGPVDSQFVLSKFKAAPGRQQPGTYLIRRSCDNHFTYYLHYVSDSGPPRVLHILQSEDTGTFTLNTKNIDSAIDMTMVELKECYDNIGTLVKDIMIPFGLKTCLHPSEFDRAPSMLLCRSISALEADIVGHNNRGGSEAKVFIPFSALSRYENVRLKGRLTSVWKGRWVKNSKVKVEVAIKQLKHCDSHLLPFMQMCYNAMLWNDPTLVTVHGATLVTQGNPMALVMEYLPLGPLDKYLMSSKQQVGKEDLVEAATALARALWYLEEQNIVHTNIRLSNVFVAAHEVGSCFKVKLGDPGLPDYTLPEEVHWLSFELLLDSCPTPSKCTTQGDVWAFATSLWQLFTFGEAPQVDTILAKNQYLNGDRLAQPQILRGQLGKIYEVMLGCWLPNPSDRNAPQTIMRDLNQLLYKVFNATKVHTYVTIADDHPVLSSPSESLKTIQTTVGSDDTVIDLSSSLPKPPPQLPPPRQPHSDITDEEIEKLQEFGTFPTTSNTLVPTFNHLMQKFREQAHIGSLMNQGTTWHGSQQALLNSMTDSSRSGSSLDGSLMNSYRSQFTMQTSISSLTSLYSMSCIYQIEGNLKTFKQKHDHSFTIQICF